MTQKRLLFPCVVLPPHIVSSISKAFFKFIFFYVFTEGENIVLETPDSSATRTVPVVLGAGFGFAPGASQTSDMLVWALGPSVWLVVLSGACQRFKWASKVPGGSSVPEPEGWRCKKGTAKPEGLLPP